MSAPPPYPRIPYLWAPSADGVGDGDRTVDPADVAHWFVQPLVVEEKVDGANVSVWLEEGRVRVASRGGLDAMDRGRQLGRLRAWASERDRRLRPLLSQGHILYGEWLWVTHGTEYQSLPDWLVVLDLWTPAAGFLGVGERDHQAAAAGLVVPPLRFHGVLGSERRLRALLGRGLWTTGPAEGLVLRAEDGQRCKVVNPAYYRLRDVEWNPDRHNALAAG